MRSLKCFSTWTCRSRDYGAQVFKAFYPFKIVRVYWHILPYSTLRPRLLMHMYLFFSSLILTPISLVVFSILLKMSFTVGTEFPIKSISSAYASRSFGPLIVSSSISISAALDVEIVWCTFYVWYGLRGSKVLGTVLLSYCLISI